MSERGPKSGQTTRIYLSPSRGLEDMSRAVVLSVTLFFALSLIAGPVAGQSQSAPHPSVDSVALYAHNEDGTDEFDGWMNALPNDGNDIAMGTAQGCTVPIPMEPINEPLDITWTLTLNPGLTETVTLASEGVINMIVHLGAGGGSGDDLEVSTVLTHGDRTLAAGDPQSYSYSSAGDDPYGTVEWELVPEFLELEPGEDLVWQIFLKGDPCSVTSGPFISSSQGRGYTRIELPATNVFFPPPVEETLEAAEPEIVLDFAESTNAIYAYAWEATQVDYEITVNAEVFAGSAALALQDEDGSVAFNLTLDEGEHEVKEHLQIDPGSWNVNITLEGFEGNLTIRLNQAIATDVLPGPGDEENGDGTDGTGASESADGNQTSALDDEEAGIPAPGIVLVALVLLTTGGLLRRRLQV